MARFLGLPRNATGNLDLSTYTIIKASCSGISGSSSLSATASFVAGQRIFICQMSGTGVGLHEDNKIASYSTGTITLVHPLENTYTDSGASQAQVVVVPEAATSSGTLTVPVWTGDVGGLFVMAVSKAAGTIVGTGSGYRGGLVSTGTNTIGQQGENTTGTQSRSTSANDVGGGGGPAKSVENGGTAGAGGSYATAGTAGTGSSAATTIKGQADLATGLFMGGGGGSAGSRDTELYNAGRAGRAGGAIIVIYADTITATVTNNGDSEGSSGAEYPGGAGAGGTILTRSKTNQGTYSASGGTGNSRDGGGGTSGNGGDGRIRHESCSISGSSTPTASTSTGGHSYCGGAVSII